MDGPGPGEEPPEQELEESYRAPVASGHFIWSANPRSGKIALVDARTLAVETLQAGFKPTTVATVPDPVEPERLRALVINSGSNDATLFDRAEPDQPFRIHSLPLHEGANRWTVSPSGDWAIAWSDARFADSPDATEGFQDLTVIDLDAEPVESRRVVVGYRPESVSIVEDDARVYVVTETGISVIDLEAGGEVLAEIGLESGAGREVVVTANGKAALVREDDRAAVDVVALRDETTQTLALPAGVTDLDLTADGTTAVAVLRSTGQVALISLVGVPEREATFQLFSAGTPGIGSVTVASSGSRAFLYSTTGLSDLAVFELTTGETRVVALKAGTRAVFASEDASHAIALLNPPDGSRRKGAFAIVPTDRRLPPKIQSTEAPPIGVALLPRAEPRGLITVSDTQRHGVYLVRMPELEVDYLPLSSPPLASGILPEEGLGFVAQEHAEGRISFIDLESGKVRTLTGFELAAQVIDGD